MALAGCTVRIPGSHWKWTIHFWWLTNDGLCAASLNLFLWTAWLTTAGTGECVIWKDFFFPFLPPAHFLFWVMQHFSWRSCWQWFWEKFCAMGQWCFTSLLLCVLGQSVFPLVTWTVQCSWLPCSRTLQERWRDPGTVDSVPSTWLCPGTVCSSWAVCTHTQTLNCWQLHID